MKKCAKKDCEQVNPQPFSAFCIAKKNKDGLNSYCRSCVSKLQKGYKAADPEGHVLKSRRGYLKYFYGITLDQYQEMLAKQNYCCAVCEVHHSVFSKSLHVDHCHKTGKIRELLCPQCNHVIGSGKENPSILRAAISYLEKHEKKKVSLFVTKNATKWAGGK